MNTLKETMKIPEGMERAVEIINDIQELKHECALMGGLMGGKEPSMEILLAAKLISVLREQHNPVQERISVLENELEDLKEQYTVVYTGLQLQADVIRSLLERVDTLKKYLEATN